MSHQDIIRAWKDREYRSSLSEVERALLPENPAGLIDLTDTELDAIAGGFVCGDGDAAQDPVFCSVFPYCWLH